MVGEIRTVEYSFAMLVPYLAISLMSFFLFFFFLKKFSLSLAPYLYELLSSTEMEHSIELVYVAILKHPKRVPQNDLI